VRVGNLAHQVVYHAHGQHLFYVWRAAVAQAGAPEPVRQVDCAIVGGGPGGLSAAVCLARMRRSVLVIDDRDGRSLWGQTNRNYLGFPNGISAAEIRLAGRRQAARYGTRFLSGRVAAAGHDGDSFRLRVEASVGDIRRETAGRVANVKRDEELGTSLGDADPQVLIRWLATCTTG